MDCPVTNRSFPDVKKGRYRIKLSKHIKLQIKAHAKLEAPRECCGFILDNGELYKAKNSSIDGNKFRIDAADYVSAESSGAIKAVYHSHPSTGAVFSEFDKFNSVSHGIVYILYSMRDNSFSQLDPSLTTFHKYIGRKFKIGKTDCFALIKDFYEFELNIKIRNYFRDERYIHQLKDYFEKGLETSGFYLVNDLQKYDCILFGKKPGSPPHHLGLYLGDDLLLHQPEKCYSRIEEYTSRHKKFTNYIMRHEQWKTI